MFLGQGPQKFSFFIYEPLWEQLQEEKNRASAPSVSAQFFCRNSGYFWDSVYSEQHSINV